MSEWREMLIGRGATIREAIAAIDRGGHQIALVVTKGESLLGTVTDGDVRRAILGGVDLDAPATSIMSANPTVAKVGSSRNALLAQMRQTRVRQLPLVDEEERLIGLESLDDLISGNGEDNIVVLMAGGIGSRLRPLTDETPKPMLEVGSKPLMETILEQLGSHGFRRIYIAVNYMADQVKERLGNGSSWNLDLRYLEEDKRMGTAGALGLLPESPSAPILVMNADLLTNLNFRHLLSFHEEQGCAATICVREYFNQLHYGVVEIENNRVAEIREKPSQRHFINAGIYVMEPDVLPLVPSNSFFDMTTLIERVLAQGKETAVFPIREFWLDIGRHEDYAAAAEHYEQLFK